MEINKYVHNKFFEYFQNIANLTIEQQDIFISQIVDRIRIDVGRQIYNNYINELDIDSDEENILTSDLLLFSLIKKIPKNSDLYLSKDIWIEGVSFKRKGDFTNDSKGALNARYTPEIESILQSMIIPSQIDFNSQFEESSTYFLNFLKNFKSSSEHLNYLKEKYNHNYNDKEDDYNIKKYLTSILDNQENINAIFQKTPSQINEAFSGQNINQECRFNVTELLRQMFCRNGEDVFKNVSEIMFHRFGIFFIDNNGEVKAIPANDKYLNFFYPQENQHIKSKHNKQFSKIRDTELARNVQYKLKKAISERINNIISKSNRVVPMAQLSSFCVNEFNLLFYPKNLQEYPMMKDPENQAVLIYALNKVKDLTSKYFNVGRIYNEHNFTKDLKNINQVALTIRKEERNALNPTLFLKLIRNNYLDALNISIQDLALLREYPDLYQPYFYKKILKNIFAKIFNTKSSNLIYSEFTEAIGNEQISKQYSNFVSYGFKISDDTIDCAILYQYFIGYGSKYLQEVLDNKSDTQIPTTIRIFFEKHLIKTIKSLI